MMGILHAQNDTLSYPVVKDNSKIYQLKIDELFSRISIPCIWKDTVEYKGVFKKILLVVNDDACCDDTSFAGFLDIEITSNKLNKNGKVFCESAIFYENLVHTRCYKLSRSNPKDAVVLKKFDALINNLNYCFCDYSYMPAE
jgi:hypothetical protein